MTPDRAGVMLDIRMSTRHNGAGQTTYEVLVRGELGDDFITELGARLTERTNGKTVIFVDVIDQAHLHGVLARLRDDNIGIERVNSI